MIGKTHPRFWKAFDSLPPAVQKLARDKYALWRRDPYHSSLKFEERRNGICVVRIGDHYRALGIREDDVIAWFWIGTHEEYNRCRF
ncbi:MAG TPA: hypothetical protein VF683_07630 [Chthoniobacterales bacterium]